MKTELYPTHYTYRVGDYAIASIHRYGNKAIVYGMLGKATLPHLAKDLLYGSLKEEGISSVEGYVEKKVLKLIKRYSKKYSKELPVVLTTGDTTTADGRDVVWVTITEKVNANT